MADCTTESAYERMGRTWLGLGNLSAPVWFIGMEAGGDAATDEAWSKIWSERFSGTPTVDLHEASSPAEAKYLGKDGRLQPMWQGLIRFRLAYAGQSTDDINVLRYQREQLGKIDGAKALLEISAYAAKSLDATSPRERYLSTRVSLLHELILIHETSLEVVACYGRTYTAHYEAICGGQFNADAFRWSRRTLCTLTLHPYQAYGKSPSPEYWIELGRKARRRVNDRNS